MQLCYRGVQHNYHPLSLEVSESELSGKYRSQAYHLRYPRHVPALEPKSNLCYRGVTYQRCPEIQTEVKIKAQLAAIARSCHCSSSQSNAPKAQNAFSAVHFNNIKQDLERRIQVAQNRGDDSLVSLLQQESEQLAS
ncbi:DUF4278 domain-containing protein [Spirulina major CS-329]|jgi:hypothetical protein|uniref:DUF4278 domain-containing protein n=1 Tax=Spirulina TaxID=1154 RepID=UPI00232B91FF|nr:MULTISPECIES: DUF4278 domain-containing protein [Spirulina]MDB9494244.1 DUF4278 domain-containing protein [Spirulina subsalsa CS-330]MDB9501841.1 DUF4278 domain-containing protein [Spirulina major CS-329]